MALKDIFFPMSTLYPPRTLLLSLFSDSKLHNAQFAALSRFFLPSPFSFSFFPPCGIRVLGVPGLLPAPGLLSASARWLFGWFDFRCQGKEKKGKKEKLETKVARCHTAVSECSENVLCRISQNLGGASWPRHCSFEFTHKIAFITCPCHETGGQLLGAAFSFRTFG